MNAVRLEDINAYYGKNKVLNGLDIDIEEGKIFGLIGPSGCGKTTLVKIIVGLHQSYTGSVEILDEKMPSLDLLKDISFMAQDSALYENLTGRDNLLFFGRLYSLEKSLLKERVEEIGKLLNLSDRLDDLLQDYSGGMKQRLALGVALIANPKVLILDEPTVGIDPLLRVEIWNEIKALSKQGTTIIITTHIMDEAENCHQIVIMRKGTIIASGTADSIKECHGANSLEEAFIKVVKEARYE